MNHRAGFINGEGDGIGIHIDVPKVLWSEKLKVADIIQRWIIPTLSLDIFLNKSANVVNLKIIFVHN